MCSQLLYHGFFCGLGGIFLFWGFWVGLHCFASFCSVFSPRSAPELMRCLDSTAEKYFRVISATSEISPDVPQMQNKSVPSQSCPLL